MRQFGRQLAMVQRIINKKGQSVLWQQAARAANVNQPWKATSGGPATFPVKMIFVRKGSFTDAIQHLLKGTEVNVGGKVGLMAGGVSFAPDLTDCVLRGGVSLAIKSIDTVDPDGTVILYLVEFV